MITLILHTKIVRVGDSHLHFICPQRAEKYMLKSATDHDRPKYSKVCKNLKHIALVIGMVSMFLSFKP